jgi:major vault protein
MPLADEELLAVRKAYVMTETTALHLRATQNFKDYYDVERKAGEEWLLDKKKVDAHIQDVYEEIVKIVNITVLSSNQYCIVMNPIGKDGKPRYGC